MIIAFILCKLFFIMQQESDGTWRSFHMFLDAAFTDVSYMLVPHCRENRHDPTLTPCGSQCTLHVIVYNHTQCTTISGEKSSGCFVWIKSCSHVSFDCFDCFHTERFVCSLAWEAFYEWSFWCDFINIKYCVQFVCLFVLFCFYFFHFIWKLCKQSVILVQVQKV